MWAIWGAPTSVWQYVALLGALGLTVVGVISIWKPRVTVHAAVICELLIRSLYLPALIVTVRQALLPQFNGVMELRWLVQFIMEYGLLALVTAISIRRLLSTFRSKKF
jgi:hypothetical protein